MDSQKLAAASSAAALVTLLTLPGLRRTILHAVRARRGWTALQGSGSGSPCHGLTDGDKLLDDLYEDADGRATPGSQRRFNTRPQKTVALVAALTGLGAAAGAVVAGYRAGRMRSDDGDDDSEAVCSRIIGAWLDLAAWVLLALQTAFLLPRRRPTQTFRLALCAFVSVTVMTTSILWRGGVGLFVPPPNQGALEAAFVAQLCTVAEAVCGTVAAVAFSLFPRRPDVYHRLETTGTREDERTAAVDGAAEGDGVTAQNGHANGIVVAGSASISSKRGDEEKRDASLVLVDRQFTASLLSRLTFSWVEGLIELARTRQLDMADLPALDHMTRSADIYARFVGSRWGPHNKPGTAGRLWWRLVRAHAFQLLLQWGMTFARVVLSFVPNYVLFSFLRRLEEREQRRQAGGGGEGPGGGGLSFADAGLLGWVVALGLSFVLDAWLFSNLRWITSTRLEMPVSSLLQSLVFAKATRLHESHSAHAKEKKNDSDGTDIQANGNANGNAKDKKDGDTKQPTKADAAKSKDKETGDAQSKQSIVNHMKLDR